MESSQISFPERFNVAEHFVDRNVTLGRGEKTAIYYGEEKITYREILENVNRTGNALKSLGIGLEDRVLLLLQDCPEFAYSFFGAIKIGAVPIPTNTLLKPGDYRYLLNDSRAKALVVSHELLPAILEVAKDLIYLKHILVVGDPAINTISFNNLIKDSSKDLTAADTSPDDPAFWLYSSGTTGFPKGAVHLHHDMVYCAENYARGVLGIHENDITFSVPKLFFAYGLGNGLYFPFHVGASAVLSPQRPTPEHVFEVISRYKPTLFFGVPTSYASLLQLEGAEKKYRLGSVRNCVSGGEALPPSIFKQWKEKFGLEILDGIGSTEILHIFISNRPGKAKAGSSGLLVPGYEARIVDLGGNLLHQGAVGILMIKGESVASYYWNKHQKTKETFIGEWINTGDYYYQDEEGFFVYVGRGDDMIKAGGIWVSPIEVENALMSHPAVLECGVVGCQDDEGLIKPKAYVVFKPNITPTASLLEEIKLHVKSSIAPYKYPRWIEAVDELPKTATGKIQRFKLRQMDQVKASGV
ncbi:MAG: 4-hydroxybenzoate--CoA ligase [Peptococcaceae bacterium BRH_c4a]|nr:MAG: 4-hydroxybenzoate--CoA ligase [Peptococcaceae bacterium BRH_c4a]